MKDFFLLDNEMFLKRIESAMLLAGVMPQSNNDILSNGLTRMKLSSPNYSDSLLDVIFDGESYKTVDYYAIRKLPNGQFVKYYLTKFYELYRPNWWSINIYFNEEIKRQFDKIDNACQWKKIYTEDSLKYAFRKYPHIYKAIIHKDRDCHYYSSLSCTINVDELSDYTEKNAVERLCNIAIEMLKELVSFKLNPSDLVKNTYTTASASDCQLPSWVKDGLNFALRIGARTLAAYIGANIDSKFELGNNTGDFDGDLPIDINGDLDINFDGDIDLDMDIKPDCLTFEARPTPSYDTKSDVRVVCDNGGTDKGLFDVFSKDNKKYIKFGTGSSSDWSNWVLIEGVNRFYWKGNWYSIKK